MRILRPLYKAARRFKRSEDGNSTIEFVLMLPLAMAMTFTTFETGMLSTRQVMLERGLDIVVRQIRIGALLSPTHQTLKERVCDAALLIPDCLNQIRMEMIVNDVRNWTDVSSTVSCVDRAEDAEPLIDIPVGGNNQLMILRACALFDPFIPTGIIGSALPDQSGGAYALSATAAFVMEPFQ